MKKLIQIISTFAISSCFGLLHAQVAPSIQWEKSFGGSADDEAFSVSQISDGGYIVAGWTDSNDGDVTGNHGDTDCWIIRLDVDGNLLWQKSLGGLYDDYACSVHQTTDGGFIVGGTTLSDDGDVSGNHGSSDYWVVKLDSSGNITWQKCLGGLSNDYANSLRQTADGGYIIAGVSQSQNGDVTGNHNSYDYWIAKLDTGGSLSWEKSLGGSNYDEATSIDQTADGGYVVTGWSQSHDGDVTGNHGFYDFWVVKTDTVGNLVWEKSFGGTGYDQPWSIRQTSDGGYIATGFSVSNDGNVSGNHGGNDCWVIRLDSLGNLVWQKSLGGSDYDRSYCVQQTIDGGFIIAARTSSNNDNVSGNHGDFDYWIVKLDTAGSVSWQKCMGGISYDEAFSIQETADDGFVVAGWSSSTDGDVSGNHGGYDFWIVKLTGDIATGVAPVTNSFISLYPNPVNTQLNLVCRSFSEDGVHLTPISEITIRVYDIEGRTVTLPTSSLQSQTSNSLRLNTEKLPNGFYTLQVVNSKTGEVQIGKFIKQN